jgi:hypothetical protein
LDRQVEVLADPWKVANGGNQAIARVAWMWAREPNALDAWHFMHGFEQRGKVARRVVWRLIVIHYLPEELHLAAAAVGCVSHVSQYLGFRAHPLVPTGIRHDTESAKIVTAFNNCYVGPHRIATPDDAQGE